MKDFFGRTIVLGQKVVLSRGKVTNAGFEVYTVEGLTNKSVGVRIHTYEGARLSYFHPRDVIVVDILLANP